MVLVLPMVCPPNGQARPNIKLLCVMYFNGAILVYFLCDHYMYKVW